MDIQIQSLHFDTSESLKEFIKKKVSKLERLTDEIITADITLKVIKPETNNNKEASIKIKVKSDELFAEKIGESFEEAIDSCCEALERQLLKHKEKGQSK